MFPRTRWLWPPLAGEEYARQQLRGGACTQTVQSTLPNSTLSDRRFPLDSRTTTSRTYRGFHSSGRIHERPQFRLNEFIADIQNSDPVQLQKRKLPHFVGYVCASFFVAIFVMQNCVHDVFLVNSRSENMAIYLQVNRCSW